MNFFNYKNSKKNLIATAVTIAVLFVVVLPALLLGGEAMALDTGLDATADAAQLPTSDNLATIIGQIIYAILGFLGIVFILLLIYGGFLRMTAQGDPGKIKTSYGIITSAVIGVVIILASYTITAFVLTKINTSVETGVTEQNENTNQNNNNSQRCVNDLSCNIGYYCNNVSGKCEPENNSP